MSPSAPAALQALLAGVRRPRGACAPQQPRLLPGAVDGAAGRGARLGSREGAALPPQVDFFRAVDGGGGRLKRARAEGEEEEEEREEGAEKEEEGDRQEEGEEEEEDVSEEAVLGRAVQGVVGSAKVARGMVRLGAGVLTAVQARAVPRLVAADEDVLVVAPTGSGKTLCYAAPVLAEVERVRAAEKAEKDEGAIKSKKRRKVSRAPPPPPVALVLVPTRELAAQVAAVFDRLAKEAAVRCVVRALASKQGLAALGGGGRVDVVVATPARAAVAVQRGVLPLGDDALRFVVLDEADRLLDDGFVEQVDGVLAACTGARWRVHAFSATMGGRAEELVRAIARNPVKVVVGGGGYGGAAAVTEVARLVSQRFVFAGGKGEQGKVTAVRAMLKDGLAAPVLVFVQTKDRAAELFRELVFDGVAVDAIHADRSGAARSAAIARFRAGSLPVLIATDVLARGLDFRAVATVLNYDMPSSAAAYVHRIGRTGRAGRRGAAVTLFTAEDAPLLRAVGTVARAAGADVPDWMLSQRRLRADEAERVRRRPPARGRVGGPGHAALPKRNRRATVPKRRDFDEGDVGGDGDGSE